jgi:hypothetical protein
MWKMMRNHDKPWNVKGFFSLILYDIILPWKIWKLAKINRGMEYMEWRSKF